MAGDTTSKAARVAYETVVAEVQRRALAGETNTQIAAAVGKSRDAVAQLRRRRLGMGYRRVLRLTLEQQAAIDARILAGATTREIAVEFAVNRGTAAQRAKRLRAQIPADLPPCACGKPNAHGGRCLLGADKIAYLRARLIDGAFVEEIAREMGMTAPNLREAYARPIIAELTGAGIRCGCGRELGHNFTCAVKASRQKTAHPPEMEARARELVLAGATPANAARELNVKLHTAQDVVRRWRRELAAQGALCPCGQPIDHGYGCKARNPVMRTLCHGPVGKSMSPSVRRKAMAALQEGWPHREIQRRTGESEWRIAQFVKEAEAAGVALPTKCAGCDRPRGHKAPCPKPKMCECGRWRYHRGPCRTEKALKSPHVADEAVYRLAHKRYHEGASIYHISEVTGLSWTTTQRLVSWWRSNSRYAPKPCVCGRPARHPGGCIKNTPRALHPRWAQRIEEMVLAGKTVREIMDDLRLSQMAVFKYALPARRKLLEMGVRCPCGQEVGHRYWCSATWDRFEMPRGHIPLEPQLDRSIKKALSDGEPVREIAKQVGIGTPTIFRIRREMPPARRQARRRVMRQRFAMSDTAYSTNVLERINRAVRAPAINRTGELGGADYARTLEDIRNDLYLAVMEGRIDIDEIELAAKRLLRRDWWDRKTAAPSADEAIGDEGGSSRADFLEDDTFLRSLDQMSIGRR